MSGIVGYSGSKSGVAGKGHIGQVVQIAHKTWASGDAYSWIGTGHNDWSWSRHSASLSFTNCGIGNKILLHGASSGYMGYNDYAVQWTWAVKDGSYIFVAIIDPEDLVKEVDEADNTFPSKEETFGASNVANIDEEEDDGGLLPAPSLLAALAIFSMVALSRRRI